MLAGIRDMAGKTLTALTGYLRSRPDPVLEHALRATFDKFDRELTVLILVRTDQRDSPRFSQP